MIFWARKTELGAFNDKELHYADLRIALDPEDRSQVNCGQVGVWLAMAMAMDGAGDE